MEKICIKCKSKFDCMENEECWCMNQPTLNEKQIDYDDCICKKCLSLQYRKKLLDV